jgi:hypothetical protein
VQLGARIHPIKLGHYGAVALSVVTLIALIIYPIPLCFDCEFPNPWGHVTAKGEGPVAVWLLIAPFLAGVFGLRRGWLVPLFVVLALLVTQPLGGVPWWSLRDNEGPIILLFGLPVTATCFGIGFVVRVIVGLVRHIIGVPAQ